VRQLDPLLTRVEQLRQRAMSDNDNKDGGLDSPRTFHDLQ
jgi:hypothetical protein